MKQIRNTPQRELVRGLVMGNDTHPSAEEIFAVARERDPSISRGTVYRNLNLLAECGEIHRLCMPVGPDRYDFQTRCHYHFICRNCLRVLDTELPYIGDLNQDPPGLPGCKTDWHCLLLIGLCPDCNR